MTTSDYQRYEFAWGTPQSDLVALRGGPRDARWYTYRDWLAARRSSRRLRCDLSRPDGAPRCYAPTTEWTERTDKPRNLLLLRRCTPACGATSRPRNGGSGAGNTSPRTKSTTPGEPKTPSGRGT